MAKAAPMGSLAPANDLYETDFYDWARRQARVLSARNSEAFDVVNLIEEVEALGRSQRHAIQSHLEILVAHLLKFRMQPERASASWRLTARNQRRQIARVIERNPSLRFVPRETLSDVYRDAVHLASIETGIAISRFPQGCPFTLDQILDPHFVTV